MKKIYLETYGCTLNQADSDSMVSILQNSGASIVSDELTSDVVVVNTCTVKGATENKIIDRLKKLSQQKKSIVVAGCLTVNRHKIKKAAPYASIVSTSSIESIAEAVDSAIHNEVREFKKTKRDVDPPRLFTKPIFRVPIEEGCVSSCYFCQTKLARPGLRSYKLGTIVEWVRKGIERGAREIQLTGMDTGAYGLELKNNLGDLLDSINELNTEHDFYVRLGMINPNHAKRLKERLASALNGKHTYKFLHIPVQTGSEKVCREMNRDHSVKDFVDLVKYFRGEIPEITIATDIIVGYPTETKEDFSETAELVKKLGLDIINISKFSPRFGTKAKYMKQIDTGEVKRRSRELTGLNRQIRDQNDKSSIGKIYEVLVTERQRSYTGRNINYRQVVLDNYNGNLGERVTVRITDSKNGSLVGKLLL